MTKDMRGIWQTCRSLQAAQNREDISDLGIARYGLCFHPERGFSAFSGVDGCSFFVLICFSLDFFTRTVSCTLGVILTTKKISGEFPKNRIRRSMSRKSQPEIFSVSSIHVYERAQPPFFSGELLQRNSFFEYSTGHE